LQKLGELRHDDKGIKQGTARTLFAVYTGTLSTGDLPNDVRVQLGELNNRGAIAIGSDAGKRMQLSDDCAFAFDATKRAATKKRGAKPIGWVSPLFLLLSEQFVESHKHENPSPIREN